jgi:hypothetical protein
LTVPPGFAVTGLDSDGRTWFGTDSFSALGKFGCERSEFSPSLRMLEPGFSPSASQVEITAFFGLCPAQSMSRKGATPSLNNGGCVGGAELAPVRALQGHNVQIQD